MKTKISKSHLINDTLSFTFQQEKRLERSQRQTRAIACIIKLKRKFLRQKTLIDTIIQNHTINHSSLSRDIIPLNMRQRVQ